jgi:hypothetical protein
MSGHSLFILHFLSADLSFFFSSPSRLGLEEPFWLGLIIILSYYKNHSLYVGIVSRKKWRSLFKIVEL